MESHFAALSKREGYFTLSVHPEEWCDHAASAGISADADLSTTLKNLASGRS